MTSREQGCASSSFLDVGACFEELGLAREEDCRLGLANSDLRTHGMAPSIRCKAIGMPPASTTHTVTLNPSFL